MSSKTMTFADEVVWMTKGMDLRYDRSIEESMLLDIALKAQIAQKLQDETPADPELTRLGLPQSWNRACAYALTVVPNGMDDTDHEAGGRYMTVRNAYIAGAEDDDEFRQKPIELRGAAKTSAEGPS